MSETLNVWLSGRGVRALGIKILDKWETGFEGFRFLRGSLAEMSRIISSVDSGESSRLSRVAARRNEGNARKIMNRGRYGCHRRTIDNERSMCPRILEIAVNVVEYLVNS